VVRYMIVPSHVQVILESLWNDSTLERL
jgi:hypothetical protein